MRWFHFEQDGSVCLLLPSSTWTSHFTSFKQISPKKRNGFFEMTPLPSSQFGRPKLYKCQGGKKWNDPCLPPGQLKREPIKINVIVPAGWVVKQDGGYCPWRKWSRTQDIFACQFSTPAPPTVCTPCANFAALEKVDKKSHTSKPPQKQVAQNKKSEAVKQ